MLPFIASRSMSFAAADLKDDNGIKTTIATSDAAASYSGAGLNGATVVSDIAYPTLGSRSKITSWPSVVAASNPGSYVDASTVTFTGTYNGKAVTRVATVAGTDGGATFIADGPMDSVSQIDVEAQTDTSGAFEFGWSGIGPVRDPNGGESDNNPWRRWAVVTRGAGAIHVAGWSGEQDTLTLGDDTPHYQWVSRIYADTAVDITVYER